MKIEQIQVAKALSSPVRVKILQLLRQRPYSLSEVARELKISKTNAKVHLEKLVKTGLINETPRSKWTYYSLKKEHASSGVVSITIPLALFIVSIFSIIQALLYTVSAPSTDHEFSFISFTSTGWLWLAFAAILFVATLVAVAWVLKQRLQ